MFGIIKDLPVDEKTAFHPVSPYAVSKATGHLLTINYREAYNLFCCCGILFNHESILRAEKFVTQKILSTAVRISQGSEERLTLGNIKVKRDWGYAPEYIKAMWLMLQKSSPDDYIIATGEAHSLEDFVDLVFKNLGLNWKNSVDIDKSLFRPSDINVIFGDATKAKNKLDWKYQVPFEELIKKLLEEQIASSEALKI